MKKILIPIISILQLAACSQSSKTPEVPGNISEAFTLLHPTATILKWNDEPPIWEAKYEDGEEEGAVSFNDQAEVVETELVISENELPNAPKIPDYIKANYRSGKIQGCEKITKQDGTIIYEIQITGKEIVFDAEGKYLSEEKD
jgi:hypothetical protein